MDLPLDVEYGETCGSFAVSRTVDDSGVIRKQFNLTGCEVDLSDYKFSNSHNEPK